MQYSEIKERVKNLRRKQTPAEKILWSMLRNRKLDGKKFLRQHPVFYERMKNDFRFFIVDFYCAEHKLIVEADGKIHDYQKDYDQNRDDILQSLKYKVLRIKNEELKDIEKVENKIREYFK